MARQLLIVDDDETIRRMLVSHFTERGFDCCVAADGLDALGILGKGQTPVMITDLDMPRMNGVALLRAVRERGLCTRSIVLTGYATLGNLTACLQEGAMVLLPKPLPSLEPLNRAVEQAFEQVQGWIDQMTAIVRLRSGSAGGTLPSSLSPDRQGP